VGDQLARIMNRTYDRLRDPAAFGIASDAAVAGRFESLRGNNYAVLVSYRRNGDAVPSPVWFGVDSQGRAYIQTSNDTGKVKRIRNNASVLIAASSLRGRPKGAALRGAARVVPESEWDHAEETLAAAYGLGRRIYDRVFSMPDSMKAYIEVSPVDEVPSG
jgi:uncharacterized protein